MLKDPQVSHVDQVAVTSGLVDTPGTEAIAGDLAVTLISSIGNCDGAI